LNAESARRIARLLALCGLVFGCLAAPLLAQNPAPAPSQTPVPAPASTAAPSSGGGILPGKSKTPAATTPAAGKAGAQGGESKSSAADSKPPSESKSASGKTQRLSSIDPSVPPPRIFSRPRIGLALGGGGALGLTEVGVLKWFEEHHIPVDMIAGTSMGCLVGSLYSTGLKPVELSHIVNDRVFTSVFSFGESYSSKSFRRREESRELPNGVTIGLKHRVSFRNAVLVDQGLNAFLDREFLRYDDQTDFNNLPIPLRCMSTDLNDAKAVTFARGSIPDSVRASLSIPGIFPPFEMDGHEYVDGQVLENLPVRAVREMNPDVVLAVSIPLGSVGQGDFGSILGVFARAYSIATEQLEVQQRRLADVVISPDISGYNVTDYLKSDDLVARGYTAAEKMHDTLMKYSIPEDQWQAYLDHRNSLVHGPAAPVLRVRITAPDRSSTLAVQRLFAPLVNKPVDTAKIEALLDRVRSDGAFDADYTVGYESEQQFNAQAEGVAPTPKDAIPVAAATTLTPDLAAAAQQGSAETAPTKVPKAGAPIPKAGKEASANQPGVTPAAGAKAATADQGIASRPGAPGLAATQELNEDSLTDIERRPILLVNVTRKKTGPPFLLLGANLAAQTSAPTRATVEAILLDQDFGGYGSELRTRVKLGYETELSTEYFRPLNPFAPAERTYFVLPNADFLRRPQPIFDNRQNHIADRQLQSIDVGVDLGWSNQRTQRLRAGLDFEHLHWNATSGSDGMPDFSGNAQRVRAQYDFDTQDRALVPQYGSHFTVQGGYLYAAVNSPNSPYVSGQVSLSRRFGLHPHVPGEQRIKRDPKRGHEVFVFAAEGGTFFNTAVAEPFRFTLGGPSRLTASAIDQYRGTDYWLVEPAILRRIAQLPQPLGQSIYLGLGLEAGQVHAPGAAVINRQDAYFGVIAETPLGVITLAPAIGSNGERKLVFTLGKIF
jgi:NTE family protein